MKTSSTTSSAGGDPTSGADQPEQRPGPVPGPVSGSPPTHDCLSASSPGAGDRVSRLEHAVRILQAAAGAGDADLARTCRTVLGCLHPASEATAEAVTGESPESVGQWSRAPLPPPGWATASLLEEGGIVHEVLSPAHPLVRFGGANGWEPIPTTVSVGVTDLLLDGWWVRTRPTVQIEGGSYYLDAARHLQHAIEDLLTAVEDPGADIAGP